MKIRIKRKKKKSKKTEVVQPKEDTPLLLISPSLDAATLTLSTSEESLSRARRLLYLSHLAATFTEIGWEFCLVLFLSALTGYQSLTLVSTYGLFSGLVVCLGGPSVGALIDTIKYTRLEVIQFFIVIQNLSVVIATIGCFSLLRMVKDTDITGFTNANSNVDSRSLASGQPTISSHTFSNFIPPFNGTTLLLLLSIHVFGAIAKLTDHAITIAMERDWIVVMSKVAAMDIDDEEEVEFLTTTNEKEYEEGKSFDSSYSTTAYSVGSLSLDDREGMDTRVIRKLKQRSWLSETNTSMKQIDLMSEVVAPAAGGFLLSAFDNNDPLNKLATDIQHWYNLSYAAVIIGILNLASLYIEFRCTKEIYCLVPSLASHSNKKVEINNDIDKIPSDSFTNSIGCGIFTLPKSISLYLQQPVAEAGLALALLYLNVLTFGGLMTAYLVWLGVSYGTIGTLRGISSVIGLFGTVAYHISERSRGLAKTGMWSILVQFGFLALCYLSLYIQNLQASLWLLVIGVCCSRIGLWAFDLTITQYMQQSVPENIRGSIGGVQNGLNSFFDLTTFGLGLIFSDPQEFHILVAAGFVSVGLASLLYYRVYCREEKGKLDI